MHPRPTTSLNTVVITAIGFALFYSWLLIPIFVVPPVLPVDDAYSFVRLGSTIALIALLLFSSKTPSLRRFFGAVVLYALLLSAGSTVRTFMGFSLVGQLLSGVGFAGLFLAWARQLGSMSVKGAGVSIALSGVIASIICIAVSFFQQQMGLLVASWLPPVSAIALIAVMTESLLATHLSSRVVQVSAEKTPAFSTAKPAVATRLRALKPALPWKLALAVVVYSMIFEFALRATVQSSAAVFNQTTLIIFICFGLACLVVTFMEYRLKQGINLSISYCVIVVFMFAALLLLSVLLDTYLALPRGIVTVGFLLFWILAVIMYSNISSQQPDKLINIFAWGLFAEQTGELLGSLFKYFDYLSPTGEVLGLPGATLASMVAALLLIVATVLILSRKDTFSRGKETLAAQAIPSFDIRCKEIAEEFGLSPREQDVLILLAQGRSNPYITTELHLSESTINTHVKAIYRKLDIHSRQDLFDIIHAQKV